jgi:hypothetical protein
VLQLFLGNGQKKPIKSTLSCPNGIILQHIKGLGETERIYFENSFEISSVQADKVI